MDDADRAQSNVEVAISEALQAHGNRPHEAPAVIAGRRICLECGEVLGAARLKANPDAVRCVECQVQHERQRGGH